MELLPELWCINDGRGKKMREIIGCLLLVAMMIIAMFGGVSQDAIFIATAIYIVSFFFRGDKG